MQKTLSFIVSEHEVEKLFVMQKYDTGFDLKLSETITTAETDNYKSV